MNEVCQTLSFEFIVKQISGIKKYESQIFTLLSWAIQIPMVMHPEGARRLGNYAVIIRARDYQ